MEKTSLKKKIQPESHTEIKRPLQIGVTPRKIPKSVIEIRPSAQWLRRMEVGINSVAGFMGGIASWGMGTLQLQKGLNEMLHKVT